MGNVEHTESTIQDLLHIRYINNVRFKIPNAYIFKSDWESDYFVLQKSSGYCYEIEIKVTRADFLADQKKVYKHQILKEGKYEEKHWKHVYDETGRNLVYENGKVKKEYVTKTKEHTFRPNKFYYCVPENMIKPEEVPDYAGLMYARDNHIITVKEPKFIHKDKLKFEEKLCDKFYYYWIHERSEVKNWKSSYDYLNKQKKQLEEELKKYKK